MIDRRLSSPHRGRAFILSILAAAFTFSIAVAASPQLHARIHPDANSTEHTCAATLIASGSYDHSAPEPVNAFIATDPIYCVDAFAPQFIESTFLGASILEHAPPLGS